MIENEKTFLPLVHFEKGDEWAEVLKLARSHLDLSGIKRLQPVLQDSVKTVAVEYHYIDKDYRDTFSFCHSKRFRTPNSRCIRLHFFDRRTGRKELAGKGRLQESYLGYSVIRPTRPNCIGRTMLHETRMKLKGCSRSTSRNYFSSTPGELKTCNELTCSVAPPMMLTRVT